MLIFDLDGTLIDSSHDIAASASEMVQSYGAAPIPEADVIPMVGDGAPVLVARALTHARLPLDTPDALRRFLTIYDRRALDRTVPYPGITEVLALLIESGPLAVLTNKPLRATEHVLQALGLRGFFTHVLGGDGPHRRKPAPDGLRVLMEMSATPPVMIGDSPADADAAEAAGCPFVLARYGFGIVRFDGRWPSAALIVDHPRELVSLADTRTFDAARVPIVMR